jgi:hypothetical protein
MGSELDSVQYHEGKFVGVGSDGGYMAPDLDDIEEGLFPFECLSDEAKALVKAYSLLRKMEFFLAGVGFAAALYLYPDLVPMILMVFAIFPVGMALEIGKKALRVAIDSEAERREEIDHYRKLSQTLCLRERQKTQETAANE